MMIFGLARITGPKWSNSLQADLSFGELTICLSILRQQLPTGRSSCTWNAADQCLPKWMWKFVSCNARRLRGRHATVRTSRCCGSESDCLLRLREQGLRCLHYTAAGLPDPGQGFRLELCMWIWPVARWILNVDQHTLHEPISLGAFLTQSTCRFLYISCFILIKFINIHITQCLPQQIASFFT